MGEAIQLQVWREANLHLRRKTDDRLDLYVDKADDGNYSYHLVNYADQVVIAVARTTLYRIGTFSDWQGLAHVLSFPRGRYLITHSQKESDTTPYGKCIWYQLEVTSLSKTVNQICWSDRWGLPLEIQTRDGRGEWVTQFVIEEVRTFSPESSLFTVPKDGFVQIDADPPEADPFE